MRPITMRNGALVGVNMHTMGKTKGAAGLILESELGATAD